MLYVNGDSWSFRTKECDHAIWPELVAEQFGLDLINDSLGCGSNSRILDSMRNRYLSGIRPDLAVFALTAHHRYHLPAPDLGSWVIGPLVALHEHSGETISTLKDFFFRHCYSDIDSVYRYYRDIWSIHQICESLDITYLCFQTWDTEIAGLNLLSDDRIIDDYVSQYYRPGYMADTYRQALHTLAKLRSEWTYYEDPVSNLLHTEDYDLTDHPNSTGHQKIAAHVINLIKEHDLS